MDVKIFEKEKSTVELVIEASLDELKAYRQEALNLLNQQLELPGFRKGKAPLSMAEKNLDPTKVLETTVDRAIPKLYAKAVLEHKLETIGSPQIEIMKFAPDNPLVFKAVVAVLPKFNLLDYKSIRVERREAKVEERQVDRLIRRLQRDRAIEKPVERAAQKGDAVEVDFDITQNNVPLEHGQGRKHPLVIGEGMFIPGFEEKVVGLKKDQEKTFSLTFPESYNKKELAGKKADFKVKVLSVKERTLPELNDEFAKRVGNFENLTDLKKQLKQNLKLDEEGKEQQHFEGEVLSKLADQVTVEIPDVLLQGELDKMGRELEKSLSAQGANLQDYLTSINKSLEQLKKGWVDQAKKRIKIGLSLRQIAKEEEIEVTEKELEDEINTTLKQNPGNEEIIKTVKLPAYKDYAQEVIRNRKIIKLLSSWAEGKTT